MKQPGQGINASSLEIYEITLENAAISFCLWKITFIGIVKYCFLSITKQEKFSTVFRKWDNFSYTLSRISLSPFREIVLRLQQFIVNYSSNVFRQICKLMETSCISIPHQHKMISPALLQISEPDLMRNRA